MHRFVRILLMAIMVTVALCTSALLGQELRQERAYVVTLAPSASVDGVQTIAAQLAATYGGTLAKGSQTTADGFVLRMSAERARVLAADPRVTSVAAMRSPSVIANAAETVSWSGGVSYTYDGSGDISQIGNDTFGYDDVGRLVQATVNSVQRNYTYDAFGNRTACTQSDTQPAGDCQAGNTINTAENKNRITQAAYDADGNLIGLQSHTYTYDGFDMMTRDQFGSLAHEFVYTAEDERIATHTVGLPWRWTIRDLSGKVLRELTSDAGTTSWQWSKDYVWRDGVLLASRQLEAGNVTTTYHYHVDHLGTPRRITDGNDQIIAVHDYFAFGQDIPGGVNESSPTALKYTGHERDIWLNDFDTLDYMHARYYSPVFGRFLSVDRHLGRLELPQTWNRYSYAVNNPMRIFDPDGNDPKDFKIIHVHVNVIYSNVDRTAPPLVTRSLRERTEAGIVQARQHYATMGIALQVNRYEGNIVIDEKGKIGGNVLTPGGSVAITDFIKSHVGTGLTMIATPDVWLPGGASAGTNITKGVSWFTVLTAISGQKDVEHEMAHSFGNTIGGTQNDLTNGITDFVWFAERTQHDLFPNTIGFSYWFEQRLREGAAKLDKSDQ